MSEDFYKTPGNNYSSYRKEIANLLRSANLKTTKKRIYLLDCLKQSDRPLTADEIYIKTREYININLSTVYRALHSLVDVGIISKQALSDGNSVFQLNNDEHKHILKCKSCGKVSYVDICPINSLLDEISEKTEYLITDHNLEFIGVCPECKDNHSIQDIHKDEDSSEE